MGDQVAAQRETLVITRRRILVLAGGLAARATARPGNAELATSTMRTEPRNGSMDIRRNGSVPSRKGPAENFSGSVRIDPLFEAVEPSRVSGASVSFEPGART